MFRNFCVVFLAALTTFILLLTFYIARSDLSLRLILFSAGDVLYIKNILPVVATAIPPFAGLSGLIYFAGRKHLVLIVLFFLSSLFCFVLYTDFVTVFLPGTLHEDKNFRTREQKQADHVLNRLTKNYLSLPQSDILRQNCTRSKPVLKKAEKNVVFIMLESMEYDFNNYKEENLIPNIEKLQKRHLSFSGRATLKPLGNTAAATVAFTYGLPLEMHDILNLVKDYDYRYLTPYPSARLTRPVTKRFLSWEAIKSSHILTVLSKMPVSKNIWTEIKLLRVTNRNIRSTTGASPTMTCMPR